MTPSLLVVSRARIGRGQNASRPLYSAGGGDGCFRLIIFSPFPAPPMLAEIWAPEHRIRANRGVEGLIDRDTQMSKPSS